MIYNEDDVKAKLLLLEERRKEIRAADRDIKHTMFALEALIDRQDRVPDPDATPSNIGDNPTKIIKITPKDSETGEDITPARRNDVSTKRMMHADIILGKTI